MYAHYKQAKHHDLVAERMTQQTYVINTYLSEQDAALQALM